jgi:transcriptional regulator with XRE-family HTH domain
MDREPNPLLDFFASELHRSRSAAGLSQEALGRRIGFSGEMVGKIENGDRRPDAGEITKDPVAVDKITVTYDLLRAGALSRGVPGTWWRRGTGGL